MKNFQKLFFLIAIIFTFGTALFGCSLSTSGFSLYEYAIENGYSSVEEFLESIENSKGKSAYEIAVQNGFEGTESEWLASLKGTDGKDGSDGTNGKDGSNGVDGTNGQDLTAQMLFEYGVTMGTYENTAQGYKQFILDYSNGNVSDEIAEYLLSVNNNSVALVGAKCLHQVVSVFIPISSGFQMGTGVVYKINENEAYVITNYHVVAISTNNVYTPANEIHLFTYNAENIGKDSSGNYVYGNGNINAEYIGGAAAYDLALLKVTGDDLATLKQYGAQEATLADTNNIEAGTLAIAIGNALGEGISLTSGYVSMDSEDVTLSIAGANQTIRSIRTDTAINSGNSGGGLFNISGELIGIVDSKHVDEATEGIGNAIPASDAKYVVENILYYYNLSESNSSTKGQTVGVHKYVVGITYSQLNGNAVLNEDNTNTLSNQVVVASVVKNKAADNMGLKVGDVITHINITHEGTTTKYAITLDYQLKQYLLAVVEGDKISFDVDRTIGETTTKITTALHTVVEEGFTICKDGTISKISVNATE